MAELKPTTREVFEMTTKQVEPDLDSWRDQERRQEQARRRRTLGALGVAAAIVAAAAIVIVSSADRTADRIEAPGVATEPAPGAAEDGPHFLDLRTGETTPLPQSLAGGSIYYVSPDRTMFAYNPCCEPPVAVSVANIDGTNGHTVTPEDVDAYGASWSPDGASLVFQGRNGSRQELGDLFTLERATGAIRRLTRLEQFFTDTWFMSPSFSPDGDTIMFHQPRLGWAEGKRFDLWSVPATGGEPTLVRKNASFGAYSPDGAMIAYLQAPQEFASTELWVADADGSDPRPLVEGSRIGWPRWSPDGSRIAYEDEPGAVYVVDVATGESTRVGVGGMPEWLDDDTLIVVPGE